MRNRILITTAAAVAAAGVLLGTAACDSSVGFDRGTSAEAERVPNGISVETTTTYKDHADAADDIESGKLPEALPTDATAIKRVVVEGTTYVSWKGAAISDASCTTDADAKAPTMPESIQRKGSIERGVTTCAAGKQATGGAFTYFWTK